mmetsp:Transcript_33460/g.74025  ORF Transcript_33460/g.74025 Transcript_33460/m.74025 type:complete len:85 (-) Transcript_33460:670-924(-)
MKPYPSQQAYNTAVLPSSLHTTMTASMHACAHTEQYMSMCQNYPSSRMTSNARFAHASGINQTVAAHLHIHSVHDLLQMQRGHA